MTTPVGRALAGMLAVFAEFEREIMRERVKAGIAEARCKGIALGRPKSAAKKISEVNRLYRKEKLTNPRSQDASESAVPQFEGCWNASERPKQPNGPFCIESLPYPFPVSDEDTHTWKRTVNYFSPVPSGGPVFSIDSGRPIDPGGSASIDVTLPKVNGSTDYVIAYLDAEEYAFQCRFRIYVNSEGELAMQILGFNRRKRSDSTSQGGGFNTT